MSKTFETARLVLLTAVALWWPMAAGAATFNVNSPLDAVDVSPGDGTCATSGGACTLRAAVQEANALSGSHIINLPAGTYTLTIAGRGELAGATGDLNIQPGKNIRISGDGKEATIVDANALDRVFYVRGATLTLVDLTVQNGDGAAEAGGGILVLNAHVPPSACFNATLTLQRVVVRGSRAAAGGGVYAAGAGVVGPCSSGMTVNVSVLDSAISGNTAVAAGGLGIEGGSFGRAIIDRSTISGNSADEGGGIAGNASPLTVINSTISSNTSSAEHGGAMRMSGQGTLTNATIAFNVSAQDAAVVWLQGSLSVRNTIIANSQGAAPANCALGGAAVTNLGHNLEFPGASCGFTLASDVHADPLLGPLARNGGPTETHAIGGAGIDAGDDATCASPAIFQVDQRRVIRLVAQCDIGAFEFAGRTLAAPGDVDGDDWSEITVYRPSTGTWWIRHSSSVYQTFSTYQWGAEEDVPAPGDYDGDGIGDIAVYRPSSGTWFVLQSNGGFSTFFHIRWGASGDVPVPGDYDGDDLTDFAVYRPSTGVWFVLFSSTGYSTHFWVQWGRSTDVTVQADYDGDGLTDPAVFRPSTGEWHVLLSGSNYVTFKHTLGMSGDVPIAANYDGDNRSDISIYRPSTGEWLIRQSADEYTFTYTYVWGTSTDVVVPGDYDGDKKTDLAFFRPSTGEWFISKGDSGYVTANGYLWGAGGDIPVLRRP